MLDCSVVGYARLLSLLWPLLLVNGLLHLVSVFLSLDAAAWCSTYLKLNRRAYRFRHVLRYFQPPPQASLEAARHGLCRPAPPFEGACRAPSFFLSESGSHHVLSLSAHMRSKAWKYAEVARAPNSQKRDSRLF